MADAIDLTKLDPKAIKVVEAPPAEAAPIDLSMLKPEEVKVVEEVRPRRTLSPLESGISGLAQGLTFGGSDEIIGAGRAAVGTLTSKEKFIDQYRKYRDEQRAHIDAAKADNPKTFMATSLGGALAIPAARVASTAAKVGMAGLQGLATGAGMSDTDITTGSKKDVNQFIEDTAVGTALGVGTQYGLSKLGDALSFLKPENLRKYASERAVKAAGAMKKDFNQLRKDGELHRVGRELLDKKIVTLFSSLEDVVERSGELKKKAGEAIGSTLKQADELVQSAAKMIDEGKLFGFLPDNNAVAKSGVAIPSKEEAKAYILNTFQGSNKRIAERLTKEVVEPNIDEAFLGPQVQKIQELATRFANKSNQTLEGLNKSKGKFGEMINFKSDSVPAEFQKAVYRIMKDEVDDTVAKIANLEDAMTRGNNITLDDFLSANFSAKGDTNISKAFQDAKQSYRTATTVGDMAQDRLGAVQSNRNASLTDYIAGTAGVTTGGLPTGIALGAVNKILRTYGASAQALGADRLADVLAKSPNALGRFGEMIEKAAKGGQLSLLNTHQALMKDPNYQRILYDFEREQRGLRLPEQNKSNGLVLPK